MTSVEREIGVVMKVGVTPMSYTCLTNVKCSAIPKHHCVKDWLKMKLQKRSSVAERF